MTAEEFFKHLYPNWGIFNISPKTQAQLKIDAECEKQQMLTFAKQYAQLKCQEQRELCVKEAIEIFEYDVKWALEVYENRILNAPEPEL